MEAENTGGQVSAWALLETAVEAFKVSKNGGPEGPDSQLRQRYLEALVVLEKELASEFAIIVHKDSDPAGSSGKKSYDIELSIVDDRSDLALTRLLGLLDLSVIKEERDASNFANSLKNKLEQASEAFKRLAKLLVQESPDPTSSKPSALASETTNAKPLVVPNTPSRSRAARALEARVVADQAFDERESRRQQERLLFYRLGLLEKARLALDPGTKASTFTLMKERLNAWSGIARRISDLLAQSGTRKRLWDATRPHSEYFQADAAGPLNLLARNVAVLFGMVVVYIPFYLVAPHFLVNVGVDPVYLIVATLVVISVLYVIARGTRGGEIERTRDRLKADIYKAARLEGDPKKQPDIRDLFRVRIRDGEVVEDEDVGRFGRRQTSPIKSRPLAVVSKGVRPLVDVKVVQAIIGAVAAIAICLLPVLPANYVMFARVDPGNLWSAFSFERLQSMLQRDAVIVVRNMEQGTCALLSGRVVAQDAQGLVVHTGDATTRVPLNQVAFVRYEGAAKDDTPPPCTNSGPVATSPATVNMPMTIVQVPLTEVSVPAPAQPPPVAATSFTSMVSVDNRTVELRYPDPAERHIILPVFDTEVADLPGGDESTLFAYPGKASATRSKLALIVEPLRETLKKKLQDGCYIRIAVKGYASVKNFRGPWEGENPRANWILAEGRREAALQALGLLSEPLPSGFGRLELTAVQQPAVPIRGVGELPRGYGFADHAAMAKDLALWFAEPTGPGEPEQEVIARSAVISLNQSDLSTCRTEPSPSP